MQQSKTREHLGFERMIFFSDGVFAISITLLILEVKVPALQQGFSESALADALLQIIPNIIGFLISFLLIGQTWIEHHRLSSFMERYDPGLLWSNLFLLLFVSFMPFATAVLSEYFFSRVAVGLYAFAFAGLGLAKVMFWRHAVRQHILAADVDPAQVRRIGRRVWATPITSLAVILAVIAGVPYAHFGFALIPFVALLLDRTV